MPDKVCFVIAPIGEEGSDIRKRSDRVFTYLIEPAAGSCGYEVIRADKISSPGIITDQIIRFVLSAPMVVADLTGHNANAFYELAIRHMVKAPLVQIIRKGDQIPFDLAATRVLQIENPDLENIEAAKADLITHIKAAETEPPQNPISMSTDLEALRKSTDPMRVQVAELFTAVSSIQAELAELKKRPAEPVLRGVRIEPRTGRLEFGAGWSTTNNPSLLEILAQHKDKLDDPKDK